MESHARPQATDAPSAPRVGSANGASRQSADDAVLGTLQTVAAERAKHDSLAQQLMDLQRLLAADLRTFEAAIAELPRGPARVQKSAAHLVDQGGKRLRPICIMLASKLGGGFDTRALDLAVAAELVHNATLLHDDVVDLGDTRRGAVAARGLFGNATSIFAGDWLLVQALKRVRGAAVGDTFGSLLDVIEHMILAESIQLDARGTLELSRDNWLRVVEGKTAALFRWAMEAGGAAGGLPVEACESLGEFGAHLGVAFQAIDDVLDLSGDADELGKDLFADLREGKMTWPLIVGFERAPELRGKIEGALEGGAFDAAMVSEVRRTLEDTGAIQDCRAMAESRMQSAIDALSGFQRTDVVAALEAAARVAVERAR